MVAFTQKQVLPAGAPGILSGITDLDVRWIGSTALLYSASAQGGGGLGAFRIGADGRLTAIDSQVYSYSSVPLSTTELLTVELKGQLALLPVGQADSALVPYTLAADGTFTGGHGGAMTVPDDLPQASCRMTTLVQNGTSYLYSAAAGSAVPQAYAVTGTGQLSALAATDAPAGMEGTVTALATMTSGGGIFLISGSSGSNRIVSYSIGPAGGLHHADDIGAEDGLPIATPTAIAEASAGNERFAIVASAGTSSLSVLKLGADGSLSATDQVMDDLNTRFAGATLVETVTAGGRDFVLTAGSDDGVSLFTLLPGGRLFHLATVADTNGTTLDNVSAVTAVAQGDRIDVVVASASEAGLTRFAIDLSRFGEVLTSGAAALLTGTAGDDILIAQNGDGLLAGGAGADSFVFDPAAAADGSLGTIVDFEVGLDRIDLSALPMLHQASQLSITPNALGAELAYGGYHLQVNAKLPGPIAAEKFTTASILNADHVDVGPWENPWEENTIPSTDDPVALIGGNTGNTLTGASGADHISGSGGNDSISGLDGWDSLYGGAGNDTILGGSGADVLVGDDGDAAGNDLLYGGEGNDTANGGAGDDSLYGDGAHDLLAGGEGQDLLDGGPGQDTLRGGGGQDTLIGGYGDDSLLGGDGTDDLRDVLFGGAGDDTMDGGYGNDSLSGGDGADQMEGGFGADTLCSNAGDDVLSGGALSDLLFAGPGADFLNGGFGYDRLNGGEGADRFYHSGVASHGSDWVQDYDAAEGDVLVFGKAGASVAQFQINFAEGAATGVAGVAEAFVIYKPTGQIVWAIVDGAAADHIDLQIAGDPTTHDLLG